MSPRVRQFFPPNASRAHLALRTAVANEGLRLDTLREILAVTNADCDLIAFAPICKNLLEIIDAIDVVWKVKPSHWGLHRWVPLLEWIGASRNHLKLNPDLGAKFDPDDPTLFPLQGYGVQRHPFYAMLWFTHRQQRVRHRLAQAQLLTAIVGALHRKYAAAAEWDGMIRAYEDHSARVEWKPLENSLEAVSMFGRRLSLTTGAYVDYLKWLPVDRPPKEFIRTFFSIKRPSPLLSQNALLSSRHIDLRRFLDKIKGARDFKRREVPAHFNRTPGYIEREMREIGNGLVGRELTYLDSRDSTSRRHSVVHYIRCKKRTRDEIKEALDADDDPFSEEESTEDIYTIEHPKQRKRHLSITGWSQLQPVVMKNQLLPFSYSNLAVTEAKVVLNDAETWLSAHSSLSLDNRELATLETFAFALTMLATGRSQTEAHQLVVFPPDSEEKGADLALFLPGTRSGMAAWRIAPINLPYHFHPEDMDATQRKPADYILLPDVLGVDRFMRFLIKVRSQRDASWAERVQKNKPFRIFRAEEKKYSEELRQAFKKMDPGGRITPARVAGFLFARLMSETSGDVTLSALVGAQDLPIARTRLYYACVRLRRIQERYVSAMAPISGLTGQGVIQWADDDLWIATRPCPTQTAVRERIGDLFTALGWIDPYKSNGSYVDYHNTFTLYSLLFVFYATAHRSINSPMLRPEQIDAKGFVWINDKDTGYNARLAWCPQELVKQVRHYASHIATVRREVAPRYAATPSRQAAIQSVLQKPCFLLKQDRKFGLVPIEATKGSIEQRLVEIFLMQSMFTGGLSQAIFSTRV